MKTNLDNVESLGAQMYLAFSAVRAIAGLFSIKLWLQRMAFKQHQKQWYNELQRHMERAKKLLDLIVGETYSWVGDVEIENENGEIKNNVTEFDISEALQTEGNRIARVILLLGNATYHQPDNWIKIETMLKLMAKQTVIPTEMIEGIKA